MPVELKINLIGIVNYNIISLIYEKVGKKGNNV